LDPGNRLSPNNSINPYLLLAGSLGQFMGNSLVLCAFESYKSRLSCLAIKTLVSKQSNNEQSLPPKPLTLGYAATVRLAPFHRQALLVAALTGVFKEF
jgi:hypothetical protein